MPSQNGSSSEGYRVYPEPLPDWPSALSTWGAAWDCHVYGFGACFSILGLWNILALYKLGSRLTAQPYFLAIIVFGVVVSILRALYMLVDPYTSRGILPGVIVRLTNDLVYPTLAAMFTLLQVAILRLVSMNKNVSTSARKHRLICIFLSVYYATAFAVTFATTMDMSLKFLILFDQGIFISWGLILCFSFVYNGFKISHFTSETNRAFKELNVYSKVRQESKRTGNAAGLALHRITKPHICDEREILAKEFEISFDSGPDTSDSVTWYGDPCPQSTAINQLTLAGNHPNSTILRDVQNGRMLQNDDSDSPVANHSVDSDTASHPSSSNTSGRMRKLNTTQHMRHAPAKRKHKMNRMKTAHAHSCPLTQMLSSKSGRRMENGLCHINRGFDKDNQEETVLSVNDVDREEATELTNIERVPELKCIEDVNETGYMADSEENSLNMDTQSNIGARGESSPRVDNHSSSPSHQSPYPLVTKDDTVGLYRIRKGRVLRKVHKVVYFATLFVFVLCVLNLYAMFGVYGVLTEQQTSEVWPWFVFNTCGRFAEIGSITCISWVGYALARRRYRRRRVVKSTDLSTTC